MHAWWLYELLADAVVIFAVIGGVWVLILRPVINRIIDLYRSPFWRGLRAAGRNIKLAIRELYEAYQLLSPIHTVRWVTGLGRKQR
jgi:hypothetical protein